MSKLKINKTSEVENRVRSLFLILLEIINTAVKANRLARVLKVSSDDPHSVLFHIGNRAGNLDKLTGPNVAQGRGYTIIWPDSKGVQTTRRCGTCFLPSGMQDDLTASAVLIPALLDIIAHINKGTDKLPDIIKQVGLDSGLTKQGKPSKALQDKLTAQCADLGPWPVPGLVKATVRRTKQGHRHPVKVYCSGVLNEDGESCKVENERAKPSKWYRALHPSTWEQEIDSQTCFFCGGPVLTREDLAESRKNTEITETVEI